MDRRWGIAFAVTLATLGIASGAQGKVLGGSSASVSAAPATLTVDNDSKDCPTAGYRTIRSAIADAQPGDTIYVCAGTYAEGPGTPGSAALIIQKNLTLTGAGADQVTVEPKSDRCNPRIAGRHPNLRSYELGAIIAVLGTGASSDHGRHLRHHRSTRTASTRPPASSSVDAQGSVNRSRVTGLDIDESANGYNDAGRLPQQPVRDRHRDGHARRRRRRTPKISPQTSAAHGDDRPHRASTTYNAVGVLVDGSTGDYSPDADRAR